VRPAARRGLALGDRTRARLEATPSQMINPDGGYHQWFTGWTDRKMRDALADLDADVVIGTRATLSVVVARDAPERLVRVGWEHIPFEIYRPPMRAEIARWFPRLDAVVSLTEADRLALAEHLGAAVRVEQIPNCLSDGIRRRSAQTNPIVIAAGRLTRVKQFDKLIRAWAEVAPAAPDWELRIFGAGGMDNKLRALVSRLHLYNSVKLMGRSNRLHDELAKASLAVLSSRAEGFPTVIMEAMSHGVPVVAFDCPNGPAEMITNNTDGVLVPLNDEAALASSLAALMHDDPRRREYADAAYAASRRYTAEAVTARWESLLSELVDARRHGR